MKRLLTLLALAIVSLVIPACHDDDDIAHTTTTTTETHSTRVAPADASTTTVRTY
jgi:hypothetical protein